MIKNKNFFIATMSIIMAVCLAVSENANAAARGSGRAAPMAAAKKAVATSAASVQETEPETVTETKSEAPVKEEFVVANKSADFDVAISSVSESSSSENSFAEQIRKQRALLAAQDASESASKAQKNALANNSNTCDRDLRKCMQSKCGKDFTKCALDGDTIFGDKLSSCRTTTKCTTEEFNLFVKEIKADLEMNVRLSSYNGVINCGNRYNACIVDECGTTYGKCLGTDYANAATKKCETIAKECLESDSGLASRFSIAIGKMRESAEKEIKRDEERMYALRDLMSDTCKKLGAMFDERTFDCVYTVNFFVGENPEFPTASRKRYAGDTFVCMQEWFGVNATTFKENADRETKSQKAASSAMLGAGVGTAAGLVTSGAVGRAMETQKAKKELKAEEKAQKADEKAAEEAEKDAEKAQKKAEKDEAKQQKKEKKEEKNNAKKQECSDGNGKYVAGVCHCNEVGAIWSSKDKKCKKPAKPTVGKKSKAGGDAAGGGTTPTPAPAS